MLTEFDFAKLNVTLDEKVTTEMASNPEVIEVGVDLDLESLPIEARRWLKVEDVVVVVADLRNSTLLAHGRQDGSVGAIYEASIGGITQIFDSFGVNYLQTQGDGAVAIFWGDDRYARATCAGITVQTFSSKILVPALIEKFENLPETGYKIGIACGDVLVKKVGKSRNLDLQTPVWARNPVNYAAKCAQQSDVHKMLVTAGIWGWLEGNDYLAISCSCNNGPSHTIWTSKEISNLRPDDDERFGRILSSTWCDIHGDAFCNAVLQGESKREDVSDSRNSLTKQFTLNSLEAIIRPQKVARINTLRGLHKVK